MVTPPGAVYKRDFWADENPKYTRPHHRMLKVARLVNRLAAGRDCRLLDVGCGPATLGLLLDPNVQYYGIDIAIGEPSPNLTERDILEEPISSEHAPFDLIVAQGLFEYLADSQSRKLAEIAELLAPNGTFIASYVNFDHRQPDHYWPYNCIQSGGPIPGQLGRALRHRKAAPDVTQLEPSRARAVVPPSAEYVRQPEYTVRDTTPGRPVPLRLPWTRLNGVTCATEERFWRPLTTNGGLAQLQIRHDLSQVVETATSCWSNAPDRHPQLLRDRLVRKIVIAHQYAKEALTARRQPLGGHPNHTRLLLPEKRGIERVRAPRPP